MPGPTLRLATFNVENLFARYRFRANADPRDADGFGINQLAFDLHDEVDKRITADAILDLNADVIALQEVENMGVLERFNARYLAKLGYRHRVLIDGNDPRQIDLALLSRLPVGNIRTHRHERNDHNTAALFSRDCLEVEIDPGAKRQPLTLYLNHFKSMVEGRSATRARRAEQVARVAAIIDEHWQKADYKGNFAVLGDFNDYRGRGSSLGALLDHPHLVDPITDLAEAERWTHYYAGAKRGEKTNQLDYLLLARGLYERAGRPRAMIMRRGLPFRAEDYDGPRFDGVGQDNPKASDHCPVAIDLPLEALG